jgi:hypothetical protein
VSGRDQLDCVHHFEDKLQVHGSLLSPNWLMMAKLYTRGAPVGKNNFWPRA